MKQVKNMQILEFTYDTKEERNEHVKLMESQGWINSGTMKRLKPGVSILDATPEDREWFADFTKYN